MELRSVRVMTVVWLVWLPLLASCAGQPLREAARRPVDAATRARFHELLVPAAECGQRAPAWVEPEAMRADVARLSQILRRGYAGFELAASEAEWQAQFARMRDELPNEPMTAVAFRDFLLERLRFTNDNHLALWVNGADGVRSWRATGGHAQAYVPRAGEARFARRDDGTFVEVVADEAPADGARQLLSCDGRDPHEVLRPMIDEASATARPPASPRTRSVHTPSIAFRPVMLAEEPVGAIACVLSGPDGARESVSYPLAALPRAALDGVASTAFAEVDAPFPWLVVRSLGASHAAQLERFVESAVTARDAEVVVLDLRGGNGGSDLYLVRFFQNLTSEPIAYFHFDALESEAVAQGALSFWRCVQRSSRADAGGRAWLDARVARATREIEETMRTRGVYRELVRHAPINRGRAPRAFSGRLIVLVDRACASACETGVMLARQIPGTLVVGENTNGTLKVGEIRSYRLPESAIGLTAGSRVHRDPMTDAPFDESVGYAPDLWLAGDARVDAAVRRLVACVRDEACDAALTRALAP